MFEKRLDYQKGINSFRTGADFQACFYEKNDPRLKAGQFPEKAVYEKMKKVKAGNNGKKAVNAQFSR